MESQLNQRDLKHATATLLSDLPSTEEIIARLNKRVDNVTHTKKDGTIVPLVCAICDKLILYEEDKEKISQNLYTCFVK